MNKAQSQAQARPASAKPQKAKDKPAAKMTPRSKSSVKSGELHHGSVAMGTKSTGKVSTKPAKGHGAAGKRPAKSATRAAASSAAPAPKAAARSAADKATPITPVEAQAMVAELPIEPNGPIGPSSAAASKAAPGAEVAPAELEAGLGVEELLTSAALTAPEPEVGEEIEAAPEAASNVSQLVQPIAKRPAAPQVAQTPAASNEDKLAHALATRPVHEAVDILAQAGVAAPSAAAHDGQSRTFRDDPSLDRRIIEGMLDDKDSFLDNMHRQGFGRDAVVRRAAELGLSEALIRQVKGVAADLAGERPGRRPTPSSLGARTCLSCDRVFFSSGPGNRLCTRCRGGDAGLAQL